MTVSTIKPSTQLSQDEWEALANRIAKELWVAQYRAANPGTPTPVIEEQWTGDVVRNQRKMIKVALRKLEQKGIVFAEGF